MTKVFLTIGVTLTHKYPWLCCPECYLTSAISLPLHTFITFWPSVTSKWHHHTRVPWMPLLILEWLQEDKSPSARHSSNPKDGAHANHMQTDWTCMGEVQTSPTEPSPIGKVCVSPCKLSGKQPQQILQVQVTAG